MKNRIFKLFLFGGLLLILINCSTYKPIETDTPNNLELSKKQEVSNTSNLNCELMSLNINRFKKLHFPIKGVTPTLHISDGQCRGSAVCNSLFGNYVKEGNDIKFLDVSMTRKGCIGNYGSVERLSGNEIEELISKTLLSVNNFAIEDNKLLLKKDSNILMVYRICN
jgi:heat shock protein HslJ